MKKIDRMPFNHRPLTTAAGAVVSCVLATASGLPSIAADHLPNRTPKLPSTLSTASAPGVASLAAAPKETMQSTPAAATAMAASPAQQMVEDTVLTMLSGAAIANEIDNFDIVSKELWRGAQPSSKAIGKLAQNGVRTIIDLRYAGPGVDQEAQVAKQCGIVYINIPLGFDHPSMANIARFWSIVSKPANQPVFLHCRQGADRTGTLVGIFRILHDHWSFTQAYNEMRLHHFKPWLSNLKSLVARYEVDPQISKDLINLAAQLEDTETSQKVSTKEPQVSI